MKHILSLSVAENVFEVGKFSEICCGSQAIRCPCFQASLSRPEFGFSMFTILCNCMPTFPMPCTVFEFFPWPDDLASVRQPTVLLKEWS